MNELSPKCPILRSPCSALAHPNVVVSFRKSAHLLCGLPRFLLPPAFSPVFSLLPISKTAGAELPGEEMDPGPFFCLILKVPLGLMGPIHFGASRAGPVSSPEGGFACLPASVPFLSCLTSVLSLLQKCWINHLQVLERFTPLLFGLLSTRGQGKLDFSSRPGHPGGISIPSHLPWPGKFPLSSLPL